MEWKRITTAILIAMAIGCGGPKASPDAGSSGGDGGGIDGGQTAVCQQDAVCEDGLFCTQNRCRPGDPSADAMGCVDIGPPCMSGEMCSESAMRCETVDCSNPDMDGDGHQAMACGGNDCDDTDANRYPGNEEVCDASHDEDCSTDTLAGASDGDVDGDGEVSASCCNGTPCGTDCDDTNAQVNTSAVEVCNGVDDDCSGMVDDAPAGSSLCPGGVCLSGACSFSAWDRIVSSPNGGLTDIAADAEGNLYVVGGQLQPGTDFGAGGTATNPLVASYTADGTLRWVFPDGDAYTGTATRVAVDTSTGTVYLLGKAYQMISLGPSTIGAPATNTTFLASFDGDWDAELGDPNCVAQPRFVRRPAGKRYRCARRRGGRSRDLQPLVRLW